MRMVVTPLCTLCLIACCGCQRNVAQSGSSQGMTGNLLGRLGLRADQVTLLVMDTRSGVRAVSDRGIVRRFYDAVDNPMSGRARCPLDEWIGFVRADGRTVLGGFNTAGVISVQHSLAPAGLALAQEIRTDPRFADNTRLPRFAIASASLAHGRTTVRAPAERLTGLRTKARELAGMWNPNSLEGCVAESEKDFLSRRKGPVVMFDLQNPITFRCLLRGQVNKRDWPPGTPEWAYPEWAGTYRTITCSRIAAMEDDRGREQAGFYSSADRRWYVTQRLGYQGTKTNGRYRKAGELYEEIVKLASP